MYLFNTTFYIEDGLTDAWMKWLWNVYAPMMQLSGKFTHPLVYRVHSLQGEEGSSSIAVQFSVQSVEDIAQWEEEISGRVAQSIQEIFGTGVLYFWTVLEPLA